MKKWSIIMIIICFVLFILSIFYSQKKTKDQHKEFRNIKLSDEIEEKIVDIYIEKGACFVSLGHDKVFLHALPNNISRTIFE